MNPLTSLALFAVLGMTLFSAVVVANSVEDGDKDFKTSIQLAVFGMLVSATGSLLVVLPSFTPTVSICNHFLVDGSEKICIPHKDFTLPAPYLENTEIVSPSGVLYTEKGEKVGEVEISVVGTEVIDIDGRKKTENTDIKVSLPEDTWKRFMELINSKTEVFYLDVYSKGKLWKVVKFKVFQEE